MIRHPRPGRRRRHPQGGYGPHCLVQQGDRGVDQGRHAQEDHGQVLQGEHPRRLIDGSRGEGGRPAALCPDGSVPPARPPSTGETGSLPRSRQRRSGVWPGPSARLLPRIAALTTSPKARRGPHGQDPDHALLGATAAGSTSWRRGGRDAGSGAGDAPFGLILGLFVALAARSSNAVLRAAATVYATVFSRRAGAAHALHRLFRLQIGLQRGLEGPRLLGSIEMPAFVAGMSLWASCWRHSRPKSGSARSMLFRRDSARAPMRSASTAASPSVLVVFPQLMRVALPGSATTDGAAEGDVAHFRHRAAGPDVLDGRANVVTKEPFLFFGVACLIYLAFSLVSASGIAALERRANRVLRLRAGGSDEPDARPRRGRSRRRPAAALVWSTSPAPSTARAAKPCRVSAVSSRTRPSPTTAADDRRLGVTLQLVAISVSLGVVLVSSSRWRLYGVPSPRASPAATRRFFRGTPLLCQLFLVYYGAGQFRPALERSGCGPISATRSSARPSPSRSTRRPTRPRFSAAPSPRCRADNGRQPSRSDCASPPLCAPSSCRRPPLVALRPLGNELVIMVKSSAVASLVTIFDLMGTTRLAFRAVLRSLRVPLRRSALSVRGGSDPPRLEPCRTAADAASQPRLTPSARTFTPAWAGASRSNDHNGESRFPRPRRHAIPWPATRFEGA